MIATIGTDPRQRTDNFRFKGKSRSRHRIADFGSFCAGFWNVGMGMRAAVSLLAHCDGSCFPITTADARQIRKPGNIAIARGRPSS